MVCPKVNLEFFFNRKKYLLYIAQWPGRGVLGKKNKTHFFWLNLMYISQLTISRSILMLGLVKVPFLGTRK